jgi:hypothetical protein
MEAEIEEAVALHLRGSRREAERSADRTAYE